MAMTQTGADSMGKRLMKKSGRAETTGSGNSVEEGCQGHSTPTLSACSGLVFGH